MTTSLIAPEYLLKAGPVHGARSKSVLPCLLLLVAAVLGVADRGMRGTGSCG